jgi:hypothetical protein
MKKITLFITAILLGCVSLSAQNLKIIRPGGNHYINDSVIVVNGSLPTRDYNVGFYVINTSGFSIPVYARWWDSTVVPSSKNAMCWSGLCYPNYSFRSWQVPNAESITANDTATDFVGYDSVGGAGTEIVRFVFANKNVPADSAWVYVKFIIAPLGVDQISGDNMHISAPYPNPAGNNVSFNYNLNNITEAKLEVYNTIGQCMQTIPVSASNNRLNISVAGLPSGIYICKFSANGAEPVFQKMIVTH